MRCVAAAARRWRSWPCAAHRRSPMPPARAVRARCSERSCSPPRCARCCGPHAAGRHSTAGACPRGSAVRSRLRGRSSCSSPLAAVGPRLASHAWHSFTRHRAGSAEHQPHGATVQPLELALPGLEGGHQGVRGTSGRRHRRRHVRVLVERARHDRRVPTRHPQHLASEHGRAWPARPAADRGRGAAGCVRRREGPAARQTEGHCGCRSGVPRRIRRLPAARQRRLDVGVDRRHRARAGGGGRRRRTPGRHAMRLALPLRTVLVALAAGADRGPVTGHPLHHRRSPQPGRRARRERARRAALARDAVSAEPWSASAHEQQALVLEAIEQLRQAKHQETLAISHEPETTPTG